MDDRFAKHQAFVLQFAKDRGCVEMPGEPWRDFIQRFFDTQPDYIALQRDIAFTRGVRS
jgi:hypothetical protein